MTKQQHITLAHSPDSDDAFMFYALATGKLTSEKYKFEVIREDIETLNHLAQKEKYDITALSFHAYAYIADKYVLTSSGASFAEKDYGPIVVGKRANERTNVRAYEKDSPNVRSCARELVSSSKVAIPGTLTTAALLLKIIQPKATFIAMPFDKIIDAVLNNEVDAGLLIHEGQLQYENFGLKKILSLIDFWNSLSQSPNFNTQTPFDFAQGRLQHFQPEADPPMADNTPPHTSPLPLPLGGNAIRRSLGEPVVRELSVLVHQSIQYALDHPNEARDYAMQFKRDLSESDADLYLSWYANQRSLDMGTEGKKAVQLLLDCALEKSLISYPIKATFV